MSSPEELNNPARALPALKNDSVNPLDTLLVTLLTCPHVDANEIEMWHVEFLPDTFCTIFHDERLICFSCPLQHCLLTMTFQFSSSDKTLEYFTKQPKTCTGLFSLPCYHQPSCVCLYTPGQGRRVSETGHHHISINGYFCTHTTSSVNWRHYQ